MDDSPYPPAHDDESWERSTITSNEAAAALAHLDRFGREMGRHVLNEMPESEVRLNTLRAVALIAAAETVVEEAIRILRSDDGPIPPPEE